MIVGAPIRLVAADPPKLKERIRFSAEQVRRIADAVHDGQLERYMRGQDANDQPMRPLKSEAYKRRKIRAGARPVRDLKLTGNLYRGLQVQSADAEGFVVGFSGAHPKVKKAAYFRQLADGFFGLSRANAEATDVVLGKIWDEQLEAIVR